MALTTIRKKPAIRRSHFIDIRPANAFVKKSAVSGSANITGNVPNAKPNMTRPPAKISSVMAAAARADESVIQGSKTVNNPKTKDPENPPNPLAISPSLRVIRTRTLGAQEISRPIISKIPFKAIPAARATVKTRPINGSASETDSANAATTNPRRTYDRTRPELYKTRYKADCESFEFFRENLAQANGPHIPAQCHDIRKLNHAIDMTTVASITSTEWSKCSK